MDVMILEHCEKKTKNWLAERLNYYVLIGSDSLWKNNTCFDSGKLFILCEFIRHIIIIELWCFDSYTSFMKKHDCNVISWFVYINFMRMFALRFIIILRQVMIFVIFMIMHQVNDWTTISQYKDFIICLNEGCYVKW